jgi:hypothetical protein
METTRQFTEVRSAEYIYRPVEGKDSKEREAGLKSDEGDK